MQIILDLPTAEHTGVYPMYSGPVPLDSVQRDIAPWGLTITQSGDVVRVGGFESDMTVDTATITTELIYKLICYNQVVNLQDGLIRELDEDYKLTVP